MERSELTTTDLARYEWQLDIPGFGHDGQRALKNASVLITRCGGLGGVVAYELAAAGVGRLVLCHAGDVTPSDLNRQLLLTDDWIGKPRIASVARRLREFNPHIEIEAHGENISPANAARFIDKVDCIVDCAPLFEERFALNHEAVRRGIPMIDCAMFGMEGQITVIKPGVTPCLRCLSPETPPAWKRRFPVLGAVSGLIGCMGAVETIKVITGLGEPLLNAMLCVDTLTLSFRRVTIRRDASCRECSKP